MAQPNPYAHTLTTLGDWKYYSLRKLDEAKVQALPYSIRVLLESVLRNCDEFEVSSKDVDNILNWEETSKTPTEVPWACISNSRYLEFDRIFFKFPNFLQALRGSFSSVSTPNLQKKKARLKAIDEIYQIHMLLHRSDLNIPAEIRSTIFANLKFSCSI